MAAESFQNSFLGRVVALVVIASTAVPQPALAASSAEQIKSDLKQENILHGEPTVAINGSEVTVSCYRKDEATDNDCKIDAVFAAKNVFAHDHDVTRVIVRFCDVRNVSAYSQIEVTIGDVSGYGVGAISKEQLLSTLRITRVGSEITTGPQSSATATAPPAASTSPVTTAVPAEPSVKVETPVRRVVTTSQSKPTSTRYARYDAYGLTLQYPQGWSAECPKGTNVLVRFSIHGTSQQATIVDLKVYDATKVQVSDLASMTPQQIFTQAWGVAFESTLPEQMRSVVDSLRAQRQQYMSSHPEYGQHHESGQSSSHAWHGVNISAVALPTNLTIGFTKSIKASQKAYWAESPLTPREYMRTVFFGSAHYLYQFNLVSPAPDAAVANRDLDLMLSQLSVANGKSPHK